MDKNDFLDKIMNVLCLWAIKFNPSTFEIGL